MPTYRYRNDVPGTFTVTECSHADVQSLARAAARDRVNVSRDTADTTWFRAVDDATGKVIGCAAVLWARQNVARVKGFFVLKEFRLRGVGDTLNDVRMALIRERVTFDTVEAFTGATRWIRRGFVEVGTRRNPRIKVWRLRV